METRVKPNMQQTLANVGVTVARRAQLDGVDPAIALHGSAQEYAEAKLRAERRRAN